MKWLDGIRTALADRLEQSKWPDGYDWHQNEAVWRWRCPCGARSRGADIKSDTKSLAEQHWLRQAQPHPEPEVYDERYD